MPYGNLRKRVAMRLEARANLDRYGCPLEEREQLYEPYIEASTGPCFNADWCCRWERAVAKRSRRSGNIFAPVTASNSPPCFLPPRNSIT